MKQERIGSFLKELRKEKNLTQEQLAEQLNVSGRTVSRWETGSNMPDISILVDLAEFYNVSIPEIIDGERKSEKMNKEVKETALKISDYAETINQKIKMRLFWLTILALIGMIAFVVIEASGLDTPGGLYERVASVGLGLGFGVLIVIAMYLSGVLGKIKARRMMHKNAKKSSNLTLECDCVKKEIIIKTLMVIALILIVFSLVFHNDMTLIIAAIMMAVCIVIGFGKKQ